jgi:transposase
MAATSKADFLRRQRTFHAGHRAVLDPLFCEGTFFDPRDLLQVKYEMLRRVRVEGRPAAAAARQVDLTRATYYEALRGWQRAEMLGLLPQRPGPRGPHKLTAEVLAYLRERAGGRLPTDFVGLAERLHKERSVHVHPRTIQKALRPLKKGACRRRTGGGTPKARAHGTRPCVPPG